MTTIYSLQVASLTSKGLSAAHVTSVSSTSTKEGVKKGDYQLLFISPELLITVIMCGERCLWNQFTQKH